MNNIRYLRELHKESAEELGKSIGKSQPTISKWENSKKIKYEDAELISKHYGVSINTVLGIEEVDDNFQKMVEIDIIDAIASCGNGIENFNPIVIGKQLISFDSLKQITRSNSENIKILKTRGDSMQPTINDSDIVWVDISYNQPTSDALYLFCIKGELFIKRIRIDFINNNTIISSDNSSYPPFSTNDPDGIRVIGKVIAITKMLG